ncbi:DUF1772 domain-containing protein [Pedobacter yonginense]|uniref:DUF1772 domain-containing protein n=1 Tax=Pedobacter yonginense TaxID=651869 RepID=A0A317EH42_9SPHI|nr:anthrone oxygenase family protein [Pedobacter yonginense]PWS26141.1 DUF1772 domain-containing protein [Pedobacter yonginense]
MTFRTLILFATIVSTALIGGLFYAYSCSVLPGLTRLSDASFLAAMQSINRAILNPLFFTTFMGTLLLLPLCTWLFYDRGQVLAFTLLLVAFLLYFGGVFLITMAGNVPLNNMLDVADLTKLDANELASLRYRFESSWNMFHQIRTLAGVVCIALVSFAALSIRTIK